MNHKKVFIYSAAAFISVLLILRLAKTFFHLPDGDLISWDQAARAEEAVRMAKELRFFQIPQFMVHVLSLNWWPPLHPLMMLPFCLILGPSIEAAVIPSLLAFIFSAISILFAYDHLSPASLEEKTVGLSLLLALTTTSPFLLSSATWAMLEIFGVGLTFFAFGFYFRGRRTNRILDYKICAVLVFLLWSLKYSYGLFASLALLFFEMKRHWPRLRGCPRSFRAVSSRLIKPVLFPAYALLAVIAGVILSGGKRFQVFGQRISLSNVYNPILYLYLYLFAVALTKIIKNWPKVKQALECGEKELLFWGALPIGIFLALPDKIKAVIKNFEAGQGVKPGFKPDHLIFYFRSLFRDYSLFVPVGVLVLLLFLFAVVKIRRVPPGLGGLILFFLMGYISLTFGFRLREGRYVATFIPVLWIGAAGSVDFLVVRFSKTARSLLAGMFFLTALAAALFSSLPIRKALEQPWAPWAHHDAAYRSLVDPVVRVSENTRNLFVSGYQDAGFGPLLSWKLHIARFQQKDFKLRMDSSDETKNDTPAFERAVAGEEMDAIVFFIVQKGKSEHLLLRWSEILRRSSHYSLVMEEGRDVPLPLRILAFKKT